MTIKIAESDAVASGFGRAAIRSSSVLLARGLQHREPPLFDHRSWCNRA